MVWIGLIFFSFSFRLKTKSRLKFIYNCRRVFKNYKIMCLLSRVYYKDYWTGDTLNYFENILNCFELFIFIFSLYTITYKTRYSDYLLKYVQESCMTENWLIDVWQGSKYVLICFDFVPGQLITNLQLF